MSVSQGYRDGRAGRNNANHSAEYNAGWLTGWRERMLAWNETCNIISGVQHSPSNKGNDSAAQ